MAKFKLPMKFRNDRIMITSKTYLKQRQDAGDASRVYDYYNQFGQVVDTVTVTYEDEKRKEISVDPDNTIMSLMNDSEFNDSEKMYWISLFLWAIHPSLKEEAKQFI